MRRRLMLKSSAQAEPEHTYIAEATYNENCYVDANHVMHVRVDVYQGGNSKQTPQLALESPISVVNGDILHFTGSQSFRNYITLFFYRNGSLVHVESQLIYSTNINVNRTAPFTGEFDAIALLFGGGGSGMSAVNIKATKNGEEWLN